MLQTVHAPETAGAENQRIEQHPAQDVEITVGDVNHQPQGNDQKKCQHRKMHISVHDQCRR